MSDWEPGDPLYRPGMHQVDLPIIEVRYDGDGPEPTGIAARWSPDKGWQ